MRGHTNIFSLIEQPNNKQEPDRWLRISEPSTVQLLLWSRAARYLGVGDVVATPVATPVATYVLVGLPVTSAQQQSDRFF